jgi:hypothetical protein
MGPKKTQPSDNSTSNMEKLQAEMNEKLSALIEQVSRLSDDLREVKAENKSLKETVQQQADEIMDLKNVINDRETHARSWSIRITNLPLPAGQESNNKVVMDTVYQELVLPILEGARSSGDINTIPACEQLIEIAHILPGRGTHKPVIVRFLSRYWRSLLFKHRREHAPREVAPTSSTSGGRPARMRFPFYEDLTKATFRQLKQLQADERVTSAWTVSGSIRFKVKDDDTVYKVSNIYETIEDIIE